MRKFILIVVATTIVSCSGGTGTSGTTVDGTDFTGTYMLDNIECYDSSLSNLTHGTSFSGTHTETVIIRGNNFTETLVAGSCTVQFTGNIIINSSGMTLHDRSVASATGGSCNAIETLNGGAITPTSISTTYSNGQTLPNVTNAAYLWNASTKAFGLLSIFTDGSGGYCFVVFTKQ